jgi:putative lipoprotein (rSAM/lipoprotein system)
MQDSIPWGGDSCMKKVTSRFFLLLLGWLGLSNCLTGPKPEYGMPHADFLLDGKVQNADTKEAIPGIQLTFQESSTYSDTLGNWSFNRGGTPFPKTYFIIAEDVDGDNNGGSFDPDTVWINPTKTKPGSGWYSGQYEQHDIVIELDESE